MQLRTFSEQVLLRVLANPGSSSYTQSFSKVFQTAPGCTRVVYLLITGGGTTNIALTVSIAANASGGSASDLSATLAATAANSIYTYEIAPSDLTTAKQFVSPKVTVTNGTFTLIELRHALYRAGDLTSLYHATWAGRQNSPSIP